MAEMTASEAREILLNLSWAVGAERRSQIAALVEQQAQEIERLNKSLQFEQNYLSRVGTHADGCYKWGPGHWDCAVQEIERLQEENEGLKCCGNCRHFETVCGEGKCFVDCEPLAGRYDKKSKYAEGSGKCDKWEGLK